MDVAAPIIKTEQVDVLLLQDPTMEEFAKEEKLDYVNEHSMEVCASSINTKAFEKVCENIESQWETMHRFAITCKPLKEQFLSEYTKYLQVVKLVTMDYERIYIDIRGFNNANIPSKFGVTLTISEFRWVINRFFKCKTGLMQEGNRTLTVTRGDKFSWNIKLKTSHKISDLWLNYGEINSLLDQYRDINKAIKDVPIYYKSQHNGNIEDNKVDSLNSLIE